MGLSWSLSDSTLPLKLEQVPLTVSSLDQDLRRYLLAALPSDEETAIGNGGFERCVDHPAVPEHQYLEGYFHALNVPGPVPSVHPRKGKPLQRCPAPLQLQALCESIRRQNAESFGELARKLSKLRHAKPLHKALMRGSHFADISVQMHWGAEIPEEHACWHWDAANSMLHLALGLQGSRTLHVKRHLPKLEQSPNEALVQQESAVYLSTPCCFPHAVQYPETRWEDRVVAAQCRVLLDEDELFTTDTDANGSTMACIMAHVASMKLKMPTLGEVQKVVRELEHGRL